MATTDANEPSNPGAIEFYGGYQVYSESGIDLTSLRENLKHTIDERLEQHRQSAHQVEAFARAIRAGKGASTRRPFVFDPQPLLRILADGHVEFVLIGGLAMVARGSNYVTKDLDVCYERSSANVVALANTLAPIHPYLRGAPPGLPFRFDPATILAGLNFTLDTDLGQLDLLGEVSGVGGYAQALSQSTEEIVCGLRIRVLTIDGLIASKKAAGRLKDRNHVLELEELKKMQPDQP